MKKRKVYTFLILIAIVNLIIWGFILIIKSDSKKEAINKSPYRSIDLERIILPAFKIGVGIGDNSLSSEDLNAKLNILIFFTFDDCSSCLFEAEFWSLTAKMFPDDVKIFGILNERKDEYVSAFIEEYGISFPIIVDDSNRLKDKVLSLKNVLKTGIVTPFKIFIGNKYIFHVEGPSKTSERQENFPERVLKLLEKIRN
jgi:peroxiredoxin